MLSRTKKIKENMQYTQDRNLSKNKNIKKLKEKLSQNNFLHECDEDNKYYDMKLNSKKKKPINSHSISKSMFNSYFQNNSEKSKKIANSNKKENLYLNSNNFITNFQTNDSKKNLNSPSKAKDPSESQNLFKKAKSRSLIRNSNKTQKISKSKNIRKKRENFVNSLIEIKRKKNTEKAFGKFYKQFEDYSKNIIELYKSKQNNGIHASSLFNKSSRTEYGNDSVIGEKSKQNISSVVSAKPSPIKKKLSMPNILPSIISTRNHRTDLLRRGRVHQSQRKIKNLLQDQKNLKDPINKKKYLNKSNR